MNRRGQKKRLKKALDVLNDIEVVDSDYDSESVLYIHVDDDMQNVEKINEHCGLVGIDKKEFLNLVRQRLEAEEDTAYLDLSLGWSLWHEPRNYAIFHSSKEGFIVKRLVAQER